MREPRTIPPQRRPGGAPVADVGPFPEREAATPLPVTAEGLRRDYPQWRIRKSDLNRWWANRVGRPTPAQIKAGCVVCVDADDLQGLADKLFHQERLRESGR